LASTLILTLDGTLAAGNVTVLASPNDGQRMRIICCVTIASLTAPAGHE
jgi:hypothetical protein